MYIYGLVKFPDPYIWRLSPAIIVWILYSQIRYVGKTDDLSVRYRNHKSCKTHTHCKNWINSVLREGGILGMLLIEVCTTDWEERERFWIAWYKEHFPGQLTNIMDGGQGNLHSEKTKRKISKALMGLHAGGKAGSSKLVDEDVLEIRWLYSTGKYTHRELSDRFEVHISTIGSILTRKTWKHIPGVKSIRRYCGENHCNAKISEEHVVEARKLYATGTWTLVCLAKRFGLSRPGMSSIVYCKGWQHIPSEKVVKRAWHGENVKTSKLTEADVQEIRRLYTTGKYMQKELATQFDVSQSLIGNIVRHESWTHI